MTTESFLSEVKGVGPALEVKLGFLNLKSVNDLIFNFPRRYDDYSNVLLINSFKPGMVTAKVFIKQATGRYVRRGMHITEAIASDATGSVRLVWFNQPYRQISLKIDHEYYVSGTFELSNQKMAILNPACELVGDFPISTARIVPIYKETKGLNSSQIRKILRQLLPIIDNLLETLPTWLTKNEKLVDLPKAVKSMHFPESMVSLEKAKLRIGFEEVFGLTLAALLNKQEVSHDSTITVPFKQTLAQSFVKNLAFILTDDQRRVVWQIYKDMSGKIPMNRLIEGDVGSGKTVVATMAGLMAMEQGYQVAFMAPTELLARQHAETIYNLLKPLGFNNQVCLLVGSMSAKQKESARVSIKSAKVSMIIGTHALIQEKVNMHKLALVIVDEQHRFGVNQRKALQIKAGHMPHSLSMTATPIPRSLALTLYGELDISIISSKPADRLPIITKLCSPNSRNPMYVVMEQQIQEGRQVFVVCPLVSDSAILITKLSAESVYKQLKAGQFKNYRIGLLHGQMKADDKNVVMQQFIEHKIDILVATTVVEVGVDIPNATMMVIENADRFGLAQLHQLRGRVGRSEYQGYCYLVMTDSSAPTKRLRAMESTNDGFKLSELDLELRGPGAIYGTLQHGQLDLRVAKLSDSKLIAKARSAAQIFIDKDESLVQYSQLAKRVSALRSVTNLN